MLMRQVESLVRGRFMGEGTGHDWWHIHRVRNLAIYIARKEGANLKVVETAALLHDIADWKFHDGDHTAGSKEARKILIDFNADQELIDHVCEIIDGVSFKGAAVQTPMRTLEGRCVQDADRLDALGAIGIARAFAYGGAKGRPLYDPDAPPAEQHESFEAYKNRQGPSTLHHFDEKLLRLRDMMLTAAGRQIADERHRFLEEFHRRFLVEWEGKI